MAMLDTHNMKALYRLQTWFSPSFPVGSYTYSHGLENAFEQGFVQDVAQAVAWIGQIVKSGNGFADVVFVGLAHEAAGAGNAALLKQVAEYAGAFCGTRELRLESEAQGAAFLEIVQKIEENPGLTLLQDCWNGPYSYPVTIGAAAGGPGIDRHATATAFLHSLVANLASALVRIVPLGQSDGQRIIALLEETVENAVKKALATDLDNLATSTLMVDMTSMLHETQYTRLFRS